MLKIIRSRFFTPSTAKALTGFHKSLKLLEATVAHEGEIIAKKNKVMSKAERIAEAARIRQTEANRFHAKITEFLA